MTKLKLRAINVVRQGRICRRLIKIEVSSKLLSRLVYFWHCLLFIICTIIVYHLYFLFAVVCLLASTYTVSGMATFYDRQGLCRFEARLQQAYLFINVVLKRK